MANTNNTTNTTNMIVDQKMCAEYTLYKKMINAFELLHKYRILSSKEHS